MAYRIRKGEPIETALRRIAREQVERAIADADGEQLHEAVHEVRKRCKRIRGLLRMVRPAFRDYSVENAAFRDAARALSQARDATSSLECFDTLTEHLREVGHDTRRFDSLRGHLEDRRDTAVRGLDVPELLAEFREAMESAGDRIDGWRLEREDFRAIGGGLAETYTRGRKAMRLAYADPAAENFHAWRKRVIYHRFHLRLLEGAWPEMLLPLHDEVKRLAGHLGDDHDLAVLCRTLTARAAQIPDELSLMTLLRLAERRRQELQSLAAPLGARVFGEKPKQFRARMRSYFDAFRRKTPAARVPPRLDAMVS